MRFVQFRREPAQGVGKMGVGVEKANGDIIDLSATNPTLPDNMCQLLEQGPTGLDKVKSIVSAGGAPVLPPGTFRLLAPITRPDKVLCVGMNYHDHCAEIGVPVPTEPVIFNKFPSTIVGPHESIKYPDVTEKLDWEVELTVVIGKEGKNIEEADALDYVFGYTVAHDVSARDWQMKNGGQYLLGKAMDTFCPLGPAIVTRDQIEDPHNLGLRTRVNGVLKQDSSTTKIIFKIHTLISHISRFVTLLPGDIILTGTPPGVGGFRKPPEFLQKGDVVECEIDQIGTLTNQIV